MRIRAGGAGHLTYCTNIHPGETWPEVWSNLQRYLPAVKQRVAPDRNFGVGLRLSAIATEALLRPAALAELQAFLREHGLYVFTVNAFPYGTFHRVRVKEEVYLPDWQDDERLRYTDAAADVLAALLPADEDVEGSVSTVPGAFKPAVAAPGGVERMATLMIRHAAHLVELQRRTGRTIALALEPEPCCFLETIDEAVDFFGEHLFSRRAASLLAQLAGLSPSDAEAALRRHLGLCLDLCHAAVEFEDPAAAVGKLRGAGIRVAKLQISAGLRFPSVDGGTEALLRPFDDGVYLHQVVERSAAGLRRYTDLGEAFAALPASAGQREWRVHCHVPIFLDDLGAFSSTQPFLRDALALHRREPISDHLEVETYTWNVLPERYQGADVVTAVARELQWVDRQLAA